jgi:hypothetical protein
MRKLLTLMEGGWPGEPEDNWGGMNKADFKRREMEIELGDEDRRRDSGPRYDAHGFLRKKKFKKKFKKNTSGMVFYNVPAGQEREARLTGLNQTKKGKWYTFADHAKINKDATEKFGKGRFWKPKNESIQESFSDIGFEEPTDTATFTQQKREGDSSLTINVTGKDMSDIHRMMKLAGINYEEVVDDLPAVVEPAGDEVEMDMVEPEMDSPCAMAGDDVASDDMGGDMMPVDDTPDYDADPSYTTDKAKILDNLRKRMNF